MEHDEHNSLSTEVLLGLKENGIARIRATVAARSLRNIEMAMPAPDPSFFGRDELLVDLGEALRSSRAIVLKGVGGIGKTQLLLQALARVGSRCLIWIDVEKFRSTSDLRLALDAVLRQRAAAVQGATHAVLDAVRACVVFDGLERMGGRNVEEIEDLLSEVHTNTLDAQLVVTTQVELTRFTCDDHFVVGGLEQDSSRSVLGSILRASTQCDQESMAALQALSDGHPLTLRLAGALSNHYGATSWALQEIEKRGASELQMPKRAKHTAATSLNVCLSLSYEALEADEARAAFLVASCPGGIYSAVITADRWLSNGRAAIAGLQHWSLVETSLKGQPLERLALLSPVALYVVSRWRAERPEEATRIVDELMQEFVLLVRVIQDLSPDADAIPQMLSRYEQELPNLMRLLELAEAPSASRRLVQSAQAVCTALMRYFFVLNLPERGVEVMLRGARIAMLARDVNGASGLLVQAAALASRGDDRFGLHAVDGLLAEILEDTGDADPMIRANAELVGALFDSSRGRSEKAEGHARRAIQLFRLSQKATSADDESASNDLSAAHSLLGLSLLQQRKYGEALTECESAMNLLRGPSIAVNRGQLLHEIANCEGGLGQHGSAARNYVRAAVHFQTIGMRDFVGNALGELGHALLELPDAQWPDLGACNVLVPIALDDLARDVVRSLESHSSRSIWETVRKLFGVIVVATSTGFAGLLVNFCARAKADVNEREGELDEFEEVFADGIAHVTGLLVVAAYVGVFENAALTKPSEGLVAGALGDLSGLCLFPFAREFRLQCFRWLATYARRRWALILDPEVLLEAATQVLGPSPAGPAD